MSTTYSHKLTNLHAFCTFVIFLQLIITYPYKNTYKYCHPLRKRAHERDNVAHAQWWMFWQINAISLNPVLGKIFLSQTMGVIAPKKPHRTTYDYANINMYEFLQNNTYAILPFSEEKECKMNAAFPDFDLQKSFKNVSSECLLRCVLQYTFVANM